MSEAESSAYREWLRRYDGGRWAKHAERTDAELAEAIARAKERIGRRRQSWHIVAAEMMDDEGRSPEGA